MQNATKNLLMKFYQANGQRKPEKLVMFRDGVSEGQVSPHFLLPSSDI